MKRITCLVHVSGCLHVCFQVADELDFMPMDEFQKEQFLFRQSEWDEYRQALPVQQGDLTDAAYFDFISFCQYATLASGMRRGRIFFEELIDANGTVAVVNRDPSLPQRNELLPAAHAERVGDRILDWINDKFPNLKPRVAAQGEPLTASSLVAGIERLANIFLLEEFCLSSSVELRSDGRGVRWTLIAPANAWSAQVLNVRGDLPNNFDVMAALAYLRRSGVPATVKTRFENGGTQVTHEITWPAGFVSTG